MTSKKKHIPYPTHATRGRSRAIGLAIALACSTLGLSTGAWAGAGFLPVTQCFRGTGAAGWVMNWTKSTYSAATNANSMLTAAQGVDTPGDGWLRLTDSNGNEAGSTYYNLPINVGSLGIQVQFTYTTWNPQNGGADGIGMFLFDGSTTPSQFVLGNVGGAQGYCAQGYNGYSTAPGLSNGVLGISLDDWGNFANAADRCYNGGETNGGHTSPYYPAVGLRGPGNGYQGYAWLADNHNLPASTYSTSTTRPLASSFYRRVQLRVYPDASASSGYQVDLDWATAQGANGTLPAASAFTQLLSAPYAFTSPTFPTGYSQPYTKTPASYNGVNKGATVKFSQPTTWNPLPPTVKFGFLGSTGGAENTHEIQDVFFTEGMPDLGITQNVASAFGNTGTFMVTVTNLGSAEATNAAFSASVSGLINVVWSCTASVGSSCPASGTGAPSGVNFSLGLVGTATFTIQGQTSSGTTISDSASLTAPTGFTDADPSNDTAATSMTVGSGTSVLNLAQTPQTTNSVSVSTVPGGQVQSSTQIYLTQFYPQNWWGDLQAYGITIGANGTATAASTPTWSASCVLMGGACAATGSSVTKQSSRTLLTWNGTAGVTLSYSNLSSAEQAAVSADPIKGSLTGTDVVNYLAGTQTKEQSNGGPFRNRTSILGDIVNSNPVYVGQPANNYPTNWTDLLYPTATMAENATSNSYGAFQTAEASRTNVVYAGSNDGMLHGFTAGSGSAATGNSSTQEAIAYMPAAVLTQIGNNSSTDPNINYNFTDPAYTHHFFVDATPGTGDLYYGGAWHTWLVGGLGAGGQALYALNITDPSNFGTGSVIKEINPATLTCVNNTNCGQDLGNTYGTPIIRRMHDGNWAVIFGNGYNSANGKAVIFIADIDHTSGNWSVYELATNAQTPNGIDYVTSADLDSDHVVDYLYAGDLFGNVWRFDVTSSNPANWHVSKFTGSTAAPSPLFTASNSSGTLQPITTQVQVVSVPSQLGLPRVMVMFGTGKDIETSDLLPNNTANGVQSVYGIWDWDMSAWDSNANATVQYAAGSPSSMVTRSDLQQQTVTTYDSSGNVVTANASTAYYRTLSSQSVCWAGTTTCASNNTQYGFYVDLPATAETVIYNPIVIDGAFQVNTTIPASNTQGLTCYPASPPGGWQMAFSPANGGALPQSFFPDSSGNFSTINGQSVMGVFTNAVGSPSVVTINGQSQLVTKVAGTPQIKITKVNPTPAGAGSRVTWIELR